MTTTTRLPGAKAIVTGGARGIGAAIARRLVDEGAEVIILDLLADTGDACAASIGATFLPVDLADPVQTRAVVASAIEELGGVDVLVNSAGVFRLVSLLDLEIDEWDRVMDINARAMLVTMQSVAPTMIAAGSGRIINLASMAAKAGGANEAHYAASKAAVVALTRAAAIEWGPHGITANSICPATCSPRWAPPPEPPSRSPPGRPSHRSPASGILTTSPAWRSTSPARMGHTSPVRP